MRDHFLLCQHFLQEYVLQEHFLQENGKKLEKLQQTQSLICTLVENGEIAFCLALITGGCARLARYLQSTITHPG